MPINLIAIKKDQPVNVLPDGTATVQIITTQNHDGTTSAVLRVDCPLDPDYFRVVSLINTNPQVINPPLNPGEIGYFPNSAMHSGTYTGQKFSITYPEVGAAKLNLDVALGDPKIDYGN